MPPSQRRSNVSSDGFNFYLLDSLSGDLAGNLGIRAVVSLGAATTGACVQRPTNIVSWWTADGDAKDFSGGNNGTLQGGTAFAAGKVGQVFQFNSAAGYVSIGNPANLRLASPMTIEGWINPRSAPPATGGANTAAVLTKGGQKFDAMSDSDPYGLWLRNNGGRLTMFTANHQAGTSEPNLQGGSIALNTWSHVAMTFDGGTGQYVLYVNGQPVASTNVPGPIATTSRNVLIGQEVRRNRGLSAASSTR